MTRVLTQYSPFTRFRVITKTHMSSRVKNNVNYAFVSAIKRCQYTRF